MSQILRALAAQVPRRRSTTSERCPSLEHVARPWRRHESGRVPQMLAGIDDWRVAEDKVAGRAPLERVHHLRHADRAANRVAALEAHLTRLLLADDAHSGGVGRRRR